MKYKNITKKRGDDGYTDLCVGGRVRKTDPRIKVVGEIDIFHATLGLCHQYITDPNILSDLLLIQRDLTLLMGEICSDDTEKYYNKFGSITVSNVEKLDNILNKVAEELDSQNASQSGWSYYGENGPAAAQLDYAGTICRKCELEILHLDNTSIPMSKLDGTVHLYNFIKIRPEILSYMNRLSKVLYLYARKLGRCHEQKK